MFVIFLSAALAAPAVNSCAYDRERTLALDEKAFDQTLNGGWRALELKPECRLIAADLIRDYRNLHPGSANSILFWHEGQMRAEAGQTAAAIRLFQRSHTQDAGWNLYVAGTIAFLNHNRPALLLARSALAKLPRPPDLKPLVFNGRAIAQPWPPNLNILDGLLKCFDRPYGKAYGEPCTQPLFRVVVPDR